MKNNSRRGYSACITARREVRINRPNSLTQVCALLTVLTTLCGAQSNTLRLVPGSGLIRPLLTPGTLAQPQEPTTPAANPKVNPWDGGLHIEILKGDRGVNIIKKKTAVTPVVEVKDRNNLPVAGIVVLFTSPSDGPSVNFLNGERTFSAVTDANGQASATALQPVNSGSFQIQVSANDKAEVATATISMTNYLTVADSVSAGNTGAAAAGGGLSHLTIGILVGVAVAAAAGIGIGLSGHSSSSAASTSTSTATIGVAGSGTVSGPH